MDLALSVGGDSSIPTLKPFSFLEITASSAYEDRKNNGRGKDIAGFCMGAAGCSEADESGSRENTVEDEEPPLQLGLLPLSPPPPPGGGQLRFPWLSHNLGTEPGFLSNLLGGKAPDVNRRGSGGGSEDSPEEGAAGSLSSPNNSGASCFQMDFPRCRNVRWWSRKRDMEGDSRGASSNNNSIGSDEEEINGGLSRKKLRLTRQQSAFLEETFKQHSTLNPKNKVALAKQLNLRPRQVEVWFQNRRARTKLKQTEVDCEYLRRCCETLGEENKRLQKEVQELRALKTTTSHPFYNHLPATTLNMCPSCTLRVASPAATATATATTPSAAANPALSLPKSEC